MKNNIFARFARAFFIFWHFVDVLVLSTTWNDLFCSCVDDVSTWWQMFNFVFLFPKRRFQLNSRIVRTHFSSIMSLNNWKMIGETRSYIFRWRSRFRRRRVCLSSLVSLEERTDYENRRFSHGKETKIRAIKLLGTDVTFLSMWGKFKVIAILIRISSPHYLSRVLRNCMGGFRVGSRISGLLSGTGRYNSRGIIHLNHSSYPYCTPEGYRSGLPKLILT